MFDKQRFVHVFEWQLVVFDIIVIETVETQKP